MNRELQVKLGYKFEKIFKIWLSPIVTLVAVTYPQTGNMLFPILIATQVIFLKYAYRDLKWFLSTIPDGVKKPPFWVLIASDVLPIPLSLLLWWLTHIFVWVF